MSSCCRKLLGESVSLDPRFARILRVAFPDTSCRKRFAELGLAQGMKVTVASTGDALMLVIGGGGGSRMGLAARCADEIYVSRIKS